MDLRELVQISTAEAHQRRFLKDLTDAFARFSKPSVAAVTGFAVSTMFPRPTKLGRLTGEQLGGGCEVALAVSVHHHVPVTPETVLIANPASATSFTLRKRPGSGFQKSPSALSPVLEGPRGLHEPWASIG